MPPKSWVWAYFYTDGQKYKNNKTDPNAWCSACLYSRMAELRESDSVAVANGLLAFEEDSTSPIAASAPPSTSASRDIGNAEEHEVEGEDDEEDVVDFEGLAEKLISAAEADDEDNNESETTTPVPQNSSSTKSTSGPNTSRKILIPLKDLFIYPGDPAAPTELEFYWKGGIAKLEETLAAYELLLESPRHSDNEAA
ncbi:hypothetical protein F5888DRAFT_277591 [Russula emetica]|nr:hypothetical protein F5888DRAFT_1826861 [Russula emetica]KAF8492845.1 hypothetical protein F5888DRAFT_1857298 [Russula emetica]KAF8497377.1 hypothetical protein F5888DRAFT_277591 [Russula emetica]